MERLLKIIFMALIMSVTCGAQAKVTKIKLAHPSGALAGDPIHEAALLFKKGLEEKSNGNIKVTIFPAGQLGSEGRNVQDIQNGIIQMAMVTSGNINSFCPSYSIFDFPYMFMNREEAHIAMDSIIDDLNEQTEKECGIITAALIEQGFRVLSNSKKPVTSLADLQGLKIRIPNNRIVVETFESFNISPIPLAWDEVFAALQQKVVDGQENPYVSLRVHKMYEIQKYVTDIHYKLWLGSFIVNSDWMKEIPKEHQKIINEVSKDVIAYNRSMIIKTEKQAKKELEEAGMVFSGAPTDEAQWQINAMSIWPKFYSDLPNISLLEKVMKSLGKELPAQY